MTKRIGLLFVLVCLVSLGAMPGYGKDYPEKDIRVYMPTGPGSSMDLIMRETAAFAEKVLGVRVFVESVTSAAGGAAFNRVYKMKPDGYNYVLMALPTLILTTLNPQVDFKPEEFTPVYAWVIDQPVLYVHSDSWRSFDEFVKAGRQEPILTGVSGLASTTHLSTVVMAETLKVKTRFISYKGGGDMMAALAGKHIQAVVTMPSTAMALEKAGKVRALLTLGAEKSLGAPNAPTPKSLGFDMKTIPWLLGIVGPPRLPEPIATTFESAIKKAVEDPKYQEFARERKLDLIQMSSKQLGEEIRKQSGIILTYEEFLKAKP